MLPHPGQKGSLLIEEGLCCQWELADLHSRSSTGWSHGRRGPALHSCRLLLHLTNRAGPRKGFLKAGGGRQMLLAESSLAGGWASSYCSVKSPCLLSYNANAGTHTHTPRVMQQRSWMLRDSTCLPPVPLCMASANFGNSWLSLIKSYCV